MVIEAKDLTESPITGKPFGNLAEGSVFVSLDRKVNKRGNVVDREVSMVGAQSQSYFLDTIQRIEDKTYGDTLETIMSFKFNRKDVENEQTLKLILNVLKYGVTVEETGMKYYRTLRTPSHMRAGGAWLSTRPAEYREIFSFGIEKGISTSFDTVVSKHESQLTLNCTNTLPTSLNLVDEDGNARRIRIAFVEDVERTVKVPIVTVKDGVNETSNHDLDGKAVRVIGEPDKAGNPNIVYDIANGERTQDITMTDGFMLATFEIFALLADDLRLTDREREYFNAIQFRMPYLKGMCVSFDIKAYAESVGVAIVKDIYGNDVNLQEVDMIIPKSVFKGAGHFKSADDYIERVLEGKFTIDGVEYAYFTNNDYLRIVNVNKDKDEYNDYTYQYLQALTNLGFDSVVGFTDTIFQYTDRALDDIYACKALLGMIASEQEDYNESLVSKVQYILELKPSAFKTAFVQNRIKDMIERMVLDQAKGRVKIKGAYHFIIGDPTLLFLNKDNTNSLVLPTDEVAGIVPNGRHFQVGKAEGDKSIATRSPLICSSEPVAIAWTSNDELMKWLGHLNGITILNSYEPVAMRAGGADYDGDKWFESEDERLINAIETDGNGQQLPLAISPLENVKPLKEPVSPEALYKADERTLDNKTGLYTNMGTFYQNMKLHVIKVFGDLINAIRTGACSKELAYAEFKALVETDNCPLESFTAEYALSRLNSERAKLLADLEYRITIVRFASAGEIDFPKHGVRFDFPAKCVTKDVPLWLHRNKMPATGVNRLEGKLGSVKYTWEEFNEFTGKLVVKELIELNTPMQVLDNHVHTRWNTTKMKPASVQANILDDLLGVGFVIPPVCNVIKDEVTEIRTRFCKAATEIQMSDLDSEKRMDAFRTMYNEFTEETTKFTDREAFAITAIIISQYDKNNSSDNFAFVCAFDGIVSLLSKKADVTPRTIRIDVPRYTDSVTVDSDGAWYVDPLTGECITVELPIELERGVYRVIDNINSRFLAFNKVLTDEDKASIVKFAQGHTVAKKTHIINLYQHIDYTMTLLGFDSYGENVETVLARLHANNGYFKIVPNEVDGVVRPGVELDGKVVGSIAYLDTLRLDGKKGAVQLDRMYGKLVKATITSDKYIKDKTTGLRKLAKSIKVDGKVESVLSINKQLEDWQTQLPLENWYFQTEWYTFANFGFNVHSFDISDTVALNQQIAQIVLERDGIYTTIPVGYVGGADSLALGAINQGGTIINPCDVPVDFKALICREVSFAFARRDYVAPEVVTDQEEDKEYAEDRAIWNKTVARYRKLGLSSVTEYVEFATATHNIDTEQPMKDILVAIDSKEREIKRQATIQKNILARIQEKHELAKKEQLEKALAKYERSLLIKAKAKELHISNSECRKKVESGEITL